MKKRSKEDIEQYNAALKIATDKATALKSEWADKRKALEKRQKEEMDKLNGTK